MCRQTKPSLPGYLTDGAQQRQTRIQSLQEQLTQLQYAYSASSSLADQAALDEEIASDLLSMANSPRGAT